MAVLNKLVGVSCTPWETAPVPFQGWRPVVRGLPEYLRLASAEGVRHALISIDNDGGARKRPPHHPAHDEPSEIANDQDGCATCLVSSAIPQSWKAGAAIAVPVQALETWLLCLREPLFSDPPEQHYHRSNLKKLYWGDARSSSAERKIALALDDLARPDALAKLHERPSFQAFSAHVAGWSLAT